MAMPGKVQLAVQVAIFIALLGVLGVSIAIIITINNQNSSSTTVAPPVPTDATTDHAHPTDRAPTQAVQTTTGNLISTNAPPSPGVTATKDIPPTVSAAASTRTPATNPTPRQDDGRFAIPTMNPISPDNPKYTTYASFANLLKQWVNASVDPCNDFYQFTCGTGAANNIQMSFDISDDTNVGAMVKQIKKDYYVSDASKPIKQLRWFFDACTSGNNDLNEGLQYGKGLVDDVLQQSGAAFPMLNQNEVLNGYLDKDSLTKLLGYQTGKLGLQTLISINVDTNWKNPHGARGYSLFIDQPSTLYNPAVYQKIWDSQKDAAARKVVSTMKSVAGTLYKKDLNPDALSKDAQDVVQFDYDLATRLSSSEVVRRKYDRSYVPMTIDSLQKQYDFVNWKDLLQLSTSAAGKDVTGLFNDTSYTVIVMEPERLADLQMVLQGTQKLASPATINNYVLYQVAQAAASYIPEQMDAASLQKKEEKFLEELRFKRRPNRRIRRDPRIGKEWRAGGVDPAISECMQQTMGALQWANTRLFVDSVYPTPAARQDIRTNVGTVVQSILVAMRSQIDQLSWMTPSSKRGAYSKIDNLAINIAYPDWVLNDTLLTAFHDRLDLLQTDSFIQMNDKLNGFQLYLAFAPLLKTGGTDRKDFSGPAGITNAWYQPEVNSITFPGGILHAPFYDSNYPAAVNFGSMGVIAGHELTHGFDDEGVQWDGTGVLQNWMDGNSTAAFTQMAQCVVDEYSNFCPLGFGQPCIDGSQTQGENIADNGGMQAAYKAYKSFVALRGPDPLLPGDFAAITPDQLFFLSFAQVWCQQEPNPQRELQQILLDPHSPSLYRVFGTIQNFPGFKNAFNCPANSVYAPEKHCNVWTSEIAPEQTDSQGIPIVKENDINVAPAEKIRPVDLSRYDAYQAAFKAFNASLNVAIDPCDDFYQYACGNYPGPANTFYDLDDANRKRIAGKLNDPTYNTTTIQKSDALKKLATLFTTCRAEQANPSIVGREIVKPFVKSLSDILGTPSILGGNVFAAPPAPTNLAQALAYLSFEHGVDTLFSPLVDTNWKAPETGYLFFLDQPTLQYQRTYYQNGAWELISEKYRKRIIAAVTNYAKLENIIPSKSLNDLVDNVLDLEKALGKRYTTDDDARRSYGYQFNNMPVDSILANLSTSFSWKSYLNFGSTPVQLNTIKTVVFNEVDKSAQLNADIQSKKLNPDDLVNYLFIRLLVNYEDLIVPTSATRLDKDTRPEDEIRTTHGRKRGQCYAPRMPAAGADDNGLSCAAAAMNLMADATGRVYVDDAFPTQQDRENIRVAAGGVIKNILGAMSGMISQLDWMDEDSKIGAQSKITNIQENVAFPDKLYQDNLAQLDAEYAELKFTDATDYYGILNDLTKFNIRVQYKQLDLQAAKRDDFLGQTAIVNAWYQPELNSITFPAGILQGPYFDAKYPAALNYGAMGIVAGHELTHGFDDEGVQWDGTGKLSSWMDTASSKNFSIVANCVINQYDNLCPLPDTYTPHCTNGVQTQGENIADNGGIHAAWRAFQAHVELNGPDPLFNDRVFSQFTENQLFFLNFAQVWCMAPPTNDYMYTRLLTDPHSLGFFRVLGSLQNLPAFRATFNCPINTKYAPADHCNVWVPFHMAK